jgi:hypothetical protein
MKNTETCQPIDESFSESNLCGNLTYLVLHDQGLTLLYDESSTGNIHLLLHELQLITSGFEQDMGH